MKVFKKRMKKLNARRMDFIKNPPCCGEPDSSRPNKQEHGLNRKGNIAKLPGSMK